MKNTQCNNQFLSPHWYFINTNLPDVFIEKLLEVINVEEFEHVLVEALLAMIMALNMLLVISCGLKHAYASMFS